jgi:hypothetical protein
MLVQTTDDFVCIVDDTDGGARRIEGHAHKYPDGEGSRGHGEES